MEKILYNSSNFEYEFYTKEEFLIKNKNDNSNFEVIEQNDFNVNKILIIKKQTFFEIYFEIISKENYENTKILLNATEQFSRYENFDCLNKCKIFPNSLDKDFWIEFFNIEKMNSLKTQQGQIIDIICPDDCVNFYVKNNKANINLDISLFLDRTNISDIEKKFIMQNFQNEQNDILPINVKKENEDLFTDFMNKDDFTGSAFKITEQEREIFNPDNIKIVDGYTDPSYEINRLVGLKNAKKELLKLSSKVDYQYNRLSRNIYDQNTTNLHMCFYGNPGTGKTTVARIVTGILYNLGYIKRNKCIEINANELKGAQIGQTAIKTKIILRNSINKVLFIDEAYALFDNHDGFGQEAVDTIIKEMEDNRQNMVIIFAGYKKEMQSFIKMNEGLKSRISRYIEFENYDTIELCKIFVNMLHEQNLKIETDAFIKIVKIFKEMQLQNNFSNGRFVRNIFEELLEEHAFNVTRNLSKNDYISLNDISDNLMEQLYIQNKNIG